MAPRRPGGWRLGIVARLLATIALPLVLVAAGAVWWTAERKAEVELAGQVVDELSAVEDVVDLRYALFAQRLAAEVLNPDRIPDVGLSPTDVDPSVRQDPDELADATAAAYEAIDPSIRPIEAAELDGLRAALAQPRDSAELSRLFEPIEDDVVLAVDRHLGAARASAIALGDESLIAASATVERLTGVPDAAGEVIARLGDLWVAEPVPRARLQSELGQAIGQMEVVVDRVSLSLTGQEGGEVARRWGDAVAMPDALADALGAASDGRLTDPDRPVGDPPVVGAALLVGVEWLAELADLPSAASTEVVERARALEADARASLQRAALAAATAVAVSVAAAIVFGRSLVLPVRRLTDRAQQVGSGRLDLEPLGRRGPPEVAGAAVAFDDMVATLTLLEQKSKALADIDFDHPSMHQPLPGRLGASLEQSVGVLSRSIREREELQTRLAHELSHDSLTGLANRVAVVEVLRAATRDGAPDQGDAVVFVALDDFKRANDRYGHVVGDELLRAVADRLRAQAPEGAMVARLGGDEFALVLHGASSPAAPLALARRVVDAVAQPIDVDGRWIRLSASAGVALAAVGRSTSRTEPLDVLRKADLAVHAAKRRVKGGVVLYDAALDEQLLAVQDVEGALAAALQPGADELRLVYQPVVRADTGQLGGVEVLLRWDRPGVGPVSPGTFVPIAESSGLILEVDRWVIGRVADQVAEWDAAGELPGVAMSINVSGRSLLAPDFLGAIAPRFERRSVDLHRITLEVTETSLITDLELVATQLRTCRDLGMSVAIDDFGTGYTSVAHLRSLPVDGIKIDMSFVQGLPGQEHRGLIEMIVQLAHHLHLPTVAEGVETSEQRAQLIDLGCDYLQGYLISEPLSPFDLVVWADRASGAGSPGSPWPSLSAGPPRSGPAGG